MIHERAREVKTEGEGESTRDSLIRAYLTGVGPGAYMGDAR